MRFFFLAMLGTACLFAQSPPSGQVVLGWKNVLPQYASFAQIKPILVNKSKHSVFLSRLYPDYAARLERFNEETGTWEDGDWGISCGTVANATVPNEIKAKSKRKIQVYWQMSSDDWEKPNFFMIKSVDLKADDKRPLEGRYRFYIRYSLSPWTLIHHPQAVYTINSPEFLIIAKE
jgi:hypothetical protein